MRMFQSSESSKQLGGAILARDEAGIPLLLEQFRSPDNSLFQLALSTAREFAGGEVDKALADEMLRATPQRAALMIQAMADRGESVVLSAVLKAAEQGPKPVRLAAPPLRWAAASAKSLITELEVGSCPAPDP